MQVPPTQVPPPSPPPPPAPPPRWPPAGPQVSPQHVWMRSDQVPPQRKRRRGWIIWGFVLAPIGLAVTITGGVLFLVARTSSSLDPIAEARTPGTATFTAEDTSYDVLLVRNRGDSARTADEFDCTVTLADGRTLSIGGNVKTTSSEVANTQSIGSFDAVAGPTSVFCDAEGGDNRFVVDEQSALTDIGTGLLIGGVVALLTGAGLIVGGFLWKQPVAP